MMEISALIDGYGFLFFITPDESLFDLAGRLLDEQMIGAVEQLEINVLRDIVGAHQTFDAV